MSIQIQDITSSEWSIDINEQGSVVQGLSDIKQCVYIICTTIKGTDPLRPDFGCGIYTYIDKPVNTIITNGPKTISDALKKYEPRIENIKVSSRLVDLSTVIFRIIWTVKNSVNTGQIDITYGLTNS